jgi:hypothetical protein
MVRATGAPGPVKGGSHRDCFDRGGRCHAGDGCSVYLARASGLAACLGRSGLAGVPLRPGEWAAVRGGAGDQRCGYGISDSRRRHGVQQCVLVRRGRRLRPFAVRFLRRFLLLLRQRLVVLREQFVILWQQFVVLRQFLLTAGACRRFSNGPGIPVGSRPVGVAVSPDGRRVYVADSSSATVSVWCLPRPRLTSRGPTCGPRRGRCSSRPPHERRVARPVSTMLMINPPGAP